MVCLGFRVLLWCSYAVTKLFLYCYVVAKVFLGGCQGVAMQFAMLLAHCYVFSKVF